MSNRYFAWTLLIAACGLQIYLDAKGAEYFGDLETVVVMPLWVHRFSGRLSEHQLLLPYYFTVILTLALPVLTTVLSWVFLRLRRRLGWNMALIVDFCFALPCAALVSINFLENLKYHHFGVQNNPEVLLLFLALLHIVLLYSPPVRALIFPPQAILRPRYS